MDRADGRSDPLVVPLATHRMGSVVARERVVVTGIVVRVVAVRWAGVPVLEVELRDVSGATRLAFLGRRSVGGVEPGALVTAAGTVGLRDGRPLLMNPLTWVTEGARAGMHGGVDMAAMSGQRGIASVGDA